MRLKTLFFLLPFLILSCGKKVNTSVPLSGYISPNAHVAIKINHLSSLKESLEKNDFLSRLENLNSFKTIEQSLGFLKHLGDESQGILVFTKSDDEEMQFVYVSEDLANFFGTDSLRAKYAETVTFHDQTLDKFTVDDIVLYSTMFQDKIFISSSQQALVTTLNGTDRRQATDIFKKLYSISDNRLPATIFINMNQSDSLLSNMLQNQVPMAPSEFSDWMTLDIDSHPDRLSLSGLSVANDSLQDYLNLFRNTKPLPNMTPTFAPLRADAILSYSFDDHRVFAVNRQKYLRLSTPTDSLYNAVEEIGLIYLNSEKAVVLKTYGSENMADFLVEIRKSAVDYQGNSILQLSDVDFLNNSFKPVINGFTANYGTILENAFVFAEKKEVLQTIISSFKNGATFDKNPIYEIAGRASASSATILFISGADHMNRILGKDFKREVYNNLKKQKLSGYVFAAQVVADGDFFHTNLSVQKTTKSSSSSIVEQGFTVRLDGSLASDPQFVLNHVTKRKEIVVQDQNNHLYLISAKGKVLWKKPLNSRIQGKIHQVDLFKNGRLQLAFTTHDQLVVLDRNGKEVKMLTKSYQGGNLNPLAVFDYDKKREYRLVVTQGSNVFMYDRKGKIVQGFTFKKAEKPILDAPQHLVIGNKDYLVFKLEDGSLKILSRTGNIRTPVKDKIDFSQSAVRRYKDQFTLTDKKGVLHQIAQSGKITRTKLNLNQDHGIDATNNTLVYMNDNVLSIKGKKLELDFGVYTPPKIFYLFDKVYVTVTDIQNQKVYLFDSQGEPIPNFPVFGASTIDLDDLDGDRKLDIVTKERDSSLITYKIN